MLVKICGIMTEDDAEYVSKVGADFVGFLFAPSKRRIAPVLAKKLAQRVNSNTKIVGVFVNESVENMIEIATYVGLDYIQLHGNESATVAKSLPYPIIKAFNIEEVTPFEITNYPCDYYLIDSPGGGTGETFNWEVLDTLGVDKAKLIVAGGLHPNNVDAAIQTICPAGVDVSSGVETNGVKDQLKISAFMQNSKKVAIK